MARPSPWQVFEDPHSAWSYLIQPRDEDLEGQHFDRKEAGRPLASAAVSKSTLDGLKEHVLKTVSAFANSNAEGGLLVIGISSQGEVLGVDHLNEDQKNSFTNLNTLVRNHAAEVKLHDCQDAAGANRTICLIYAGYMPNAICESPETNSRAWVRNGSQSNLMTPAVRDRVRLRKGILDGDSLPCCPFSAEDVDGDVLREFRRVFHPESTRKFTDERLLYEAGAVVRSNGETSFTLPGLLFFASNPQRVLSYAYVRLMKFLVPSSQYKNRGSPSFDKDFRGPITKQIRDARTFLRETAFFERFQFRRPEGGFDAQPELPPIAVDEAMVNAVAHRDYSMKTPTECEQYTDAFIVKNAGRMLQRNVDLPDRFSLGTTTLDSMPRNRKLLEWLRLMRDPEGNPFVQALSEGTKRMSREMIAVRLPPPSYLLLENETVLKLESNAEQRRAAYLASIHVPTTAFLNIYPLEITEGATSVVGEELHARLGECTTALRDSLVATDWYINRFSFSRIVAHRTGVELPVPVAVRKFLHLYPGYCFQIHELKSRLFLSIDYTCQVLSILKAHEALRYLAAEDVIGHGCVAHADSWRPGRLLAADAEWCLVHFFDSEEELKVASTRVIPTLSLAQMGSVLGAEGISFDLHTAIRRHSLVSETGAARKRAERIHSTAKQVVDDVFPLNFGEITVNMTVDPVSLSEFEPTSPKVFRLETLSEPTVEFRDHQKLADVREGITRYGSFNTDPHSIELIPLSLSAHRKDMETVIERLKAGKFKYRGAERTFATRFSYSSVITADRSEDLDGQVARLLAEHPDWAGSDQLNRLFLVQTPESDFPSDDERSPYFVIKRRLLEAGIPCQMVDTQTLIKPDFKDLNLSLNIIAKCGVVPWVLPETIPDADFFVGLSYTQSRDGQKILGFANVFNSYGKWEFYAGNTTAFDVRTRSEHLASLVRSALERLKRERSLPANPNLVFQHSVRISKDDYSAILGGVRSVSPDAAVLFVWINAHNNFRLFDSRPETDGSIPRGSYVQISKRRLLLSTTGHNAYRKALGTPQPLEISGDRYTARSSTAVVSESRTLALQVLSLTKLNWASTDSFSAEPITIKYAGDIAYLTAAFLRQREPFRLHPVLERTPWFI